MMTRRHVLVLVPLAVCSVVTGPPLAAQERKSATVTLIIEGMT